VYSSFTFLAGCNGSWRCFQRARPLLLGEGGGPNKGLKERWSRYAAALVSAHLLGTLSVALAAPERLFAPFFPALTLEGEFIAKNFVLLAAALAVLRSGASHRL
jgi:hypothetical protein